MVPIRSLAVVYDGGCGLCTRARDWLRRQDPLISLEFVVAGSSEARERFPSLPAGELAVIGNNGDVWLGNHAWIVCLWALRDYRDWAARFSSPLLLLMAREAFALVSSNRAALSGMFHLRSDTELEQQLRTILGTGMRNQTEMKEGSKGVETRLRILEAALELFREKGFDATTMRDIAAKAAVATGAAYYYFPSKDAIVLDFYRQTNADLNVHVEHVLSGSADLQKRLAGLIEVKLRYFGSSRRLLAALAAHVDPEHPLSPFSEQTREIREQDIALFERAISGSRVSLTDDLKAALPRLLWLYQMGLILYWIHDRSSDQRRTATLIDRSLRVVVRLIKLSRLPLMGPLRRQVLELYDVAAL